MNARGGGDRRVAPAPRVFGATLIWGSLCLVAVWLWGASASAGPWLPWAAGAVYVVGAAWLLSRLARGGSGRQLLALWLGGVVGLYALLAPVDGTIWSGTRLMIAGLYGSMAFAAVAVAPLMLLSWLRTVDRAPARP